MNKIILFVLFVMLFVIGAKAQEETTEDFDDFENPEVIEEEKVVFGSLIAHKEGPREAVLGEEFKVTLTIHNVGEEPVYDVHFEEIEWLPRTMVVPKKDEEGNVIEGEEETITKENEIVGKQIIIKGELTGSVEKIEAQSSFQFEYTVTPKQYNPIVIFPAVIKYKTTEEDSEYKICRSTDLPRVQILTQKQYEKRHTPQWIEWLKFTLLSGITIALPALLHLRAHSKVCGKKKQN